MQFIEEAKHWWRMFSVQAMGLAIAIQLTWDQLPPSMVSYLPAGLVSKLTMGLLVLGVIGRLVKQKSVGDPPAP